jgi:hypothetical protein
MHKHEGSSTAILLTVILTLSISSFIMIPTRVLAANPPTITLSPTAGPVGIQITINGTDFQPGATVDLSWYGYIVDVPGITGHLGYYPINAGVTVASDGSFVTTFITPYDISDVSHFVNATQNGSGTGIVNGTFTIMPSMQLSPTPTNYTEGQEVILHIYGGPTGTIPVPPTMELESLKFTYDNTNWGYDDSHLTTEGPVATGGFTGGDIGGNITIRFAAVGGVGEHDIRAFEGPSTTAAWLSCEIGGEVNFTIVGPSLDAQAILSQLSQLNAEIVSVQGDTATIKTNLGNVTTSLGDINAQIVSLQGNVATISTNLGTLTGTVTSVNGTVDTIQTSLGTLEVSDQGVKNSSDTTENYALAALVLSIISIIILLAVAIQVFRKHK